MANRLNRAQAKSEVVKAAHEELRRLESQRADVTKRIRLLKTTLGGLATMFGNLSLSDDLLKLLGRHLGPKEPRLTKLCRCVLIEADHPMTANEICAEMQRRMPLLLERHKHPLASVTAVLTRLAQSGDAQPTPRENGPPTWEWVRHDSVSPDHSPEEPTPMPESETSIQAE